MVTSPKIIGTIPITARLPYGTRSQLEHLVPFFRAEAARASALPTAPVKGMSRQVAASRRSRWKQEMQQLRRAGELTDTVIALVTGGLVKEIAGREWDREWPDPPHQAYGGRWPGSPEGAWPEKLTVDLPGDLVHIVRAACWNTSKEGICQLYRWHERHPAARPHCRTRPGCTAEALAEYTQLTSKIITPGVIWRAAFAHGIHTAEARHQMPAPVLISTQATAPRQRSSTSRPGMKAEITGRA
ncbi:hypothetical protein SAMN04487981_12931 [Streptomyces sp. cf386]|nr:hypothetical protein SAMN04487981_12931 [Streptomyces sp. cf386]